MAWAGWGAGPAGAGAAGGPGKVFLLVLAGVSGVVAGLLLRDGRWGAGVAAAGATLYFVLRALGILGGRGGRS